MMQAIGGFFELELPLGEGLPQARAHLYQSARAAFCALLHALPHVRRVWMPAFLCDSMYAPLQASGKDIAIYSLDDQLQLAGPIDIGSDEIVLYVNYFGVRTDYTDELLSLIPPEQLVIDCSQAFFAAPRECLANIYSPRKFFGVPDGGLLVTNLAVACPEQTDDGSLNRMTHLLARLAGEPEPAYADFQQAEQSLDDPTPLRMSALTRRLLGSVQFASIRQHREANFAYLRNRLDASNLLQLPTSVGGPLCYPFLPTQALDRTQFVSRRIYIPTYWPDVRNRSTPGSMEHAMVERCLPIPCDQRYTPSDLDRILDLIPH